MRRRGGQRLRRPPALVLGLLAAAALSACGGAAASGPSSPGAPSSGPASSGPASSGPSAPGSGPASSGPGSGTPSGSADPSDSGTQLPGGGTSIIGHYRVIAYYGAAGAPALGVLGQSSPEHCADKVIHRAAEWKGLGLPVQPAFELLATVAQGSPGNGGDYSAPVPHATIERYLKVAHEHHMLLILDLQPGGASFLSQAKKLRPLLLDPSVSLALDPEWKEPPGVAPAGRIGSTTAGAVNAVGRYLSSLIAAHHLPDKLMIVHEFTLSMLPDRQDVVRPPGVQVTFHADGFGTRAVKRGVYHGLGFPSHPWGAGFKLFLQQDTRLMTPHEVLRLSPKPDVITYE